MNSLSGLQKNIKQYNTPIKVNKEGSGGGILFKK